MSEKVFAKKLSHSVQRLPRTFSPRLDGRVLVVGHMGSGNEFIILLELSKGAISRMKILRALVYAPKTCNQIVNEVGLNWRTVNRHLQILGKAHLIELLIFGERKFYTLTQTGIEYLERSSNIESKEKR